VSVTVNDVPADATALAVNVTFTETADPGFFTVWGAGDRPVASTGNADAGGQTRAIFTLVPGRTVQVFSQAGAHVVVDIVGYFTGPSAPSASNGLFIPRPPDRAFDTRNDRSPLWPGGAREMPTPSNASALWMNLTLTDTLAPGYVTAWPAGTARPDTSSVNADDAFGATANAAIVMTAERGVALWSSAGTQVVGDIAGVFLGAPVASSLAPLANPEPHVALDRVIGTSVDGRPLTVAHVFGNPTATRKVLVLGSMHGDERAGTAVVNALRTAPIPPDVDLWLMPTMNPDGAVTNRRTNSNGVDLNRNFTGGLKPWCATPGCGDGTARNTGTAPLSEPESAALWSLGTLEHFDLIVSYHQPLDVVDCSPAYAPLQKVCSTFAVASNLDVNRSGYMDLSGTMTNSYMVANPGRYAFTVEFGANAPSKAAIDRHITALWAAVAML
jgi:hypothetical protein